MRYLCTAVGLTIFATSTGASAERWVTLYDNEEEMVSLEVDADSIHRESDGLVYFRSRNPSEARRAVDCSSRVSYTLWLSDMGGIDIPDWRSRGEPVTPGSFGEMELQYACARTG